MKKYKTRNALNMIKTRIWPFQFRNIYIKWILLSCIQCVHAYYSIWISLCMEVNCYVCWCVTITIFGFFKQFLRFLHCFTFLEFVKILQNLTKMRSHNCENSNTNYYLIFTTVLPFNVWYFSWQNIKFIRLDRNKKYEKT